MAHSIANAPRRGVFGTLRRTLLLACMLFTLAAPCFAQESSSSSSRDDDFDSLASEIAALERQANLLRKVVRLIKPSVVHIEAASATRSVEEAGGGVVVELSGKHYVLTNRHVVKESELEGIEIKLADGRRLNPVAMWDDPGTDVAVLQIRASRLVPARLGDSNRAEIGDFVLAVGSPFGLSHSVTFGIISAKGRRDLQLGDDRVRFQDFLQTDAAINPGNSGGPLANLRGEIIGINTAIASSSGGNEGIGFTIPINMVRVIAQQLIQQGRVARAYLGVHLSREFEPSRSADRLGLPSPRGALVSGITPNSPAANAKIRTGDAIVKVNGRWIDDDDHLINMVSLMPVGTEINVTLYRERKPMSIKVRVGNRADYEPME